MSPRSISFTAVLKAALLAGLAAGLATAAFHTAFTEGWIERAIAFEQASRQVVGSASEVPLVSREGQRWGLIAGWLILGLSWSLVLAAIYPFARRWSPEISAVRRALLLAGLGFWSFALIPFLKYPANPPGVGDPATIGYRQLLFVGLLAASVVATAAAIGLGRARRLRWPATGALMVASGVLLLVLFPANLDPVSAPPELMLPFRALSLVGLMLFWGVLGLSFGLVVGPEVGGSPARRRARLPGAGL